MDGEARRVERGRGVAGSALAGERDWKGLELELSQVFFREKVPPVMLVQAAMSWIGHRVGKRQ